MSTGTFKLLVIWFFLFSCPARAFFVLGVVGKGSPSSPGKKIKKIKNQREQLKANHIVMCKSINIVYLVTMLN